MIVLGRRRVGRVFTRLLRNRRGSVLVEWGLVAPVLFLLIMVVIELSMITFINNMVEGGLKEASRWAITGQDAPSGMTRQEYVKKLVKEHTYGLIADSDIAISTKVYPTFSDIGKGEPFNDTNGNSKYDAGEPFTDMNGNGQWDADMGTEGVGQGGDIVAYTVDYKWRVLTPLLMPFAESEGEFDYTATLVVKNEPY